MPLPPEVIESFPEEIRNEKTWEKYDDLGGVAKAYIEQQKLNGRSIAIPDEKAKPEDLEKWKGEHLPKLAARGIIELPPSTAEDYKVPEGFTADEGLVKSFVDKVGLPTKLTQKQFEAAVAWQNEISKQFMVSDDAAEAEFKQLLGDDYAVAMEKVTTGMKAMSEDMPHVGEWLKTARVVEGNGQIYPAAKDPMIRAIFEGYANATQEDRTTGMTAGGETLESVESKIQDIRDNKDMNDDEKGRRLDPLYKMKAVLRGRT
jgi:hypothetical protein